MRLVSALYNDFYPFHLLFNDVNTEVVFDPEDLQKEDVLIVWGGADISPSLYNKQPARQTHATEKLSNRDQMEWNLMLEAKAKNIPIIGICRG